MQGGVAQADVFVMLPIPLPQPPFAAGKPNYPAYQHDKHYGGATLWAEVVDGYHRESHPRHDGALHGADAGDDRVG